ncbi:hypothetical protein [Shigella sonnei]|uniref:hypothetical protein n=1 Tax=Shigella sonnei TaxID=624 RepID=UPI002096777B|nr:hypothetical protein [Shigella sonnei]
MTGELKIGTVNALRIFNDTFGLIFRRSEDFLHFIPTAEGQGENGNIGPLRPFAINLRTGAISVSHGAKIKGGLAIGATDNALGENSIVLEITTPDLGKMEMVLLASIQMVRASDILMS